MCALSGVRAKAGWISLSRLIAILILFVLPAQTSGKNVSSRIAVSAVVLPSAVVHTIYQSQSVRITGKDLALGYVDEPAATIIQVRSQRGCLVSFGALDKPFARYRVNGGPGIPETAETALAYNVPGIFIGASSGTVRLNYRFYLDTGQAAPGEYRWPLPVEVAAE